MRASLIKWRRTNEAGQVLLIGVIVILGLSMLAISVANIGAMVAEKMHLQDTVDAAAYSEAVVEARYMNLSAYVNRAMLANYNAMAFNTSLWAVSASYDHGMASAVGTMYLAAALLEYTVLFAALGIPLDNAAYGLDQSVHRLAHEFQKEMKKLFSQDGDDLNKYIEQYTTDILSSYQGLLYSSLQAARYEVGKEVARRIDPDVRTTSLAGLAAETISNDELRERVDWVVEEAGERSSPFNLINQSLDSVFSTHSDDKQPYLLGALAEASLDKFSAGRTRQGGENLLRSFNFGNIIPGWIEDTIEAVLDAECYAECTVSWIWGGCDCNAQFNVILGSQMRYGQEDTFAETRTPVIARQRMREVNSFGADVSLDGAGLVASLIRPPSWQYTSGHLRNDIRNMANYKDVLRTNADRWWECLSSFGGCNYNEFNDTLSHAMGAVGGVVAAACGFGGGGYIDEHWDGSWEPVACGVRYANFTASLCWGDVISYIEEVCSEGDDNQVGFDEGVPKYDWRVNLNRVGFPSFYDEGSNAEERLLKNPATGEAYKFIGPSVAVVGVKDADKVRGLKGLKLNNTYPLTAISRAQVYYQYNPNRSAEKPSLFNPHWVARLAPIDVTGSPALLREGLPYVLGGAQVIRPTH